MARAAKRGTDPWEPCAETRGCDTRLRLEPIDQTCKKDPQALGRWVPLMGECDLSRGDAIGSKSGIYALEMREAPNEEPGAGEQYEPDRHLKHDQPVLKAVPASRCHAASALLQEFG